MFVMVFKSKRNQTICSCCPNENTSLQESIHHLRLRTKYWQVVTVHATVPFYRWFHYRWYHRQQFVIRGVYWCGFLHHCEASFSKEVTWGGFLTFRSARCQVHISNKNGCLFLSVISLPFWLWFLLCDSSLVKLWRRAELQFFIVSLLHNDALWRSLVNQEQKTWQ
jgi:hypothetical protein